MSSMVIALQITALGMGLVFAAIILLWWMMNLLTAITADRQTAPRLRRRRAPAADTAATAPAGQNARKAQAAAAAVAVMLAEQKVSRARPLAEPPATIVSAWQLGMRTRQLYEKRAPRIQNPRKAG